MADSTTAKVRRGNYILDVSNSDVDLLTKRGFSVISASGSVITPATPTTLSDIQKSYNELVAESEDDDGGDEGDKSKT